MNSATRPPATAQSAEAEWMLNGPDFFKKIVVDRRATRHFTDEPVPDTVLRSILSMAQQAPSGYNFQPWRFVVVRERANRKRLQKAAFDQEKIGEAPVVIVAFGQRDGWKEKIDDILRLQVENGTLEASQVQKTKEGALQFLTTLDPALWLNRHVMIAFTFLMLAAEAAGWDTAPMEGFDAAAVREALDLPGDAEVMAILAIGRAAKPLAKYPGRLPLDAIFYDEKYGQHWRAEMT